MFVTLHQQTKLNPLTPSKMKTNDTLAIRVNHNVYDGADYELASCIVAMAQALAELKFHASERGMQNHYNFVEVDSWDMASKILHAIEAHLELSFDRILELVEVKWFMAPNKTKEEMVSEILANNRWSASSLEINFKRALRMHTKESIENIYKSFINDRDNYRFYTAILCA